MSSPDLSPQGTRVPRLSSLDLQEESVQPGHRPGDRYVRIVRPRDREFRREASGYLVATERVLVPKTAFGRAIEGIRLALLGQRIRTESESQERVGIAKGLALYASDNIS